MPTTPARAATPDNVDVASALALAQMIHGYVVTQVVSAVARLDLGDQFGDATRPGSELADAIGAHPDASGDPWEDRWCLFHFQGTGTARTQ